MPALEMACVAVGCARNINTAMKRIFRAVRDSPSWMAKPRRQRKTARVSPLPVAWSRVKKSGKRRRPIVAVMKKNTPPRIHTIERAFMKYVIFLPFHFQVFCCGYTSDEIQEGIHHTDIDKHINPVVHISEDKEYDQCLGADSGDGGYPVKHPRTEYSPVKSQKNKEAQTETDRNKKYIHMKPHT